jgi:hypothetical protein
LQYSRIRTRGPHSLRANNVFQEHFMRIRSIIVAIVLSATSLLAASAFAQDPTLDQVYRAASSGNLAQAERMMDQVLRDHPNSAKAHFVQAEILAKQGRGSAAQTELATAERLQPGLPFAKAESVQDLQRRIASGSDNRSGSSMASAAGAGMGGGLPWGTIIIGLVVLGVIFLAIRAMRNRSMGGGAYMPANRAAGYGGVNGPQPGQPYGPAPGYPGGGMAPGMGGGLGGGIMGGLATGAALGAGMVAGEALAHRIGGGGSHADPGVAAGAANDGSDLGGNDFGVADNGSWDDGGSFGGVSGDSGGGDWS